MSLTVMTVDKYSCLKGLVPVTDVQELIKDLISQIESSLHDTTPTQDTDIGLLPERIGLLSFLFVNRLESPTNTNAVHNIPPTNYCLTENNQLIADVYRKVLQPFLIDIVTEKLSIQLVQKCWPFVMNIATVKFVQIPGFFKDILEILLDAFKTYNDESEHLHKIQQDKTQRLLLMIGLLVAIVENVFRLESDESFSILKGVVFKEARRSMKCSETKVVGRILNSLMPKILSMGTDCDEYMREIWNAIITCFYEHEHKFSIEESLDPLSERSVFLLCGVADMFFPPEGFPKLVATFLQGEEFWDIIQNGFFHSSPLTRKRTMYLFKRVMDIVSSTEMELPRLLPGEQQTIFWWSKVDEKQLTDVWENYVLLMETLEEKQVHVIRPLMPRFSLLINASSHTDSGCPVLHTSWLACLAMRAASHDSKHIHRWIVQQLLEIDYNLCPFQQQGQAKFLCGPFIHMLSATNLYHKPAGVCLGECPPITQSMSQFFTKMSKSEDKDLRYLFFSKFVKGLSQQHWSGAALVYVIRSMSFVEQAPLFDESVIDDIRQVMGSVVSTLEVNIRSVIQHYLMVTFMKLLDTKQVSIGSFCSVLSTLRLGEAFKRGTKIHSALVEFIEKECTREQHWSFESLQDYLKNAVSNFLKVSNPESPTKGHDTEYLYTHCVPIARLTLLMVGGHVSQQEKGQLPLLQTVLSPAVDVLTAVNTHAYMSGQKARRAMALLRVFVEEAQPISGNMENGIVQDVEAFVAITLEDILLFIQRNISELTEMSSLCTVTLYADIVDAIATNYWSVFSGSTNLALLLATCIQISNTAKQEKSLQSKLAAYASYFIMAKIATAALDHIKECQLPWLQQLLTFCQQWEILQTFSRPEEVIPDDGNQQDQEVLPWGKLASCYLSSQWCCQHLYLTHAESTASSLRNTSADVDACLTSMDLVGGEDMLPMMKCLVYLVRKVPDDKQTQVFDICWRRSKEFLKSACFWQCYSTFMDLTFHPLVLCQDPDSSIGQCMKQIIEELFCLGGDKGGMVNEVLTRLSTWFSNSDEASSLATMYTDIFVQGLMFGTIHSRGKRFFNEVYQFLKTEQDLSGINLSNGINKEDSLVRAESLSLLASLNPSHPSHQTFAHSILNQLVLQYEELLELNTYRNFANSLQHRHKYRVFSGLLILQQFINQEDMVVEMLEFLQHVLLKENQPSLRCLAEWLMILLLRRSPHLMDRVWEEMKQSSEKKAAYLCSLMSVVAHMGKLVQGVEEQVDFFNKALASVLPWCMAHHFNVRIYGQASLLSLWNYCRLQNLDIVLKQHSIIEAFISFTETNRNACKNTFRLLDNFFFKFHPLRDYSMQTIVYTLPRLTGMTDEEWIPMTHFVDVDRSWERGDGHVLPLYNTSDDLKTCTPGLWRIRQEAPNDDEDPTGVASGDVQKKMIPWRRMLPETELDLDLVEDYGKKRRRSGGLVLVASLIDKIPNLGGLCRTGEIFGISEFVIGNLRFVEDRGFESLSVSAHKWLPLKEVRPEFLKLYLLEMKDAGYTLVGVEQTAQSCCLKDYTFPEKTLLLLGNEKEGIPVELIQLLDVCVEIPQQGIVRSLNVHVSGALLIWEYTRQQLDKADVAS